MRVQRPGGGAVRAENRIVLSILGQGDIAWVYELACLLQLQEERVLKVVRLQTENSQGVSYAVLLRPAAPGHFRAALPAYLVIDCVAANEAASGKAQVMMETLAARGGWAHTTLAVPAYCAAQHDEWLEQMRAQLAQEVDALDWVPAYHWCI